MHRLISTKQALMSRVVILRNELTGTEDRCFDDSEFPGYEYEGFYFMEPGKTYECKIALFGDMEPSDAAEKALCRVLREDVICGRVHMVEVKVGQDIYYVRRSDVEGQRGQREFYFYYTRKDLIQVNDVVNHHLIWGIGEY